MSDTPALLAEMVACRNIVDDYARRLDEACTEYYQSGKTEFPNLSRAENEDVYHQCERVLQRTTSIIPDALERWNAIKYPSDQYDEMVERMRDAWVRRRNLFRVLESSVRTRLELADASRITDSRRTSMRATSRVLIIHGHDELNLFALKDLIQAKLKLPEPVIMAQQMVPGASLPEKFERLASTVEFAVALLTPDDEGRALGDDKLKARPRQNTLVEIGWFWGRLGRGRVLLLVKEDLELPSDLQGVEFHRFRNKVQEVSEKVRDFFEAHRAAESGA